MEVILGGAHSLHNGASIESVIGKLFGFYCAKSNFNETKIAHLLDLVTELFPNLYLPTQDFLDHNLTTEYFGRITEFYSVFFTTLGKNVNFVSKIFKKLMEPIRANYSDLSEDQLEFLDVVEEFFIGPLLEKMNFGNEGVKEFIQSWDSFGKFKEYILFKNKNLLYGFS